MDMEAGVEHLTRGTSQGVDLMLVVVEPGRRSLETAQRIHSLADDLRIQKVWAVANKVRGEEDRRFVEAALDGVELVCSLPYSAEVVASGMGTEGISSVLTGEVGDEFRGLVSRLGAAFPDSS